MRTSKCQRNESPVEQKCTELFKRTTSFHSEIISTTESHTHSTHSDTSHQPCQLKSLVFRRTKGWAWVVITSAFFIQAFSIGLAYSFGVFFTFWLEAFQESKSVTAWITSLNMGIFYGCCPLSSALTNKFSHRLVVIIGSLLASFGFLVGALSKNVYSLYLTFGVMGGFGLALIYIPTISIVSAYFMECREYALAVLAIGPGIGSLVGPLIINAFIERYGWRGGLILTAGMILQSCVFGALLRPLSFWTPACKTKSRTEIKECNLAAIFDVSVLKEIHFHIFIIATMHLSLGASVPYALLTGYAKNQGISSTNSAWLLSFIGMFSLVGRATIAVMIHRAPCNSFLIFIIFAICLGLTVCSYQIHRSFEAWILASTTFGFFYGLYSGILPIIVLELFGATRLSGTYGYTMLGYGVGALVGPPFTGSLYGVNDSYDLSFYVGGGFVIFSGLLLFIIPLYKKTWRNFHEPSRTEIVVA